MKTALRIFLIDHILSCGSFVVALPFFASTRSAESDFVGFERLSLRKEGHGVLFLADQDPIHLQIAAGKTR